MSDIPVIGKLINVVGDVVGTSHFSSDQELVKAFARVKITRKHYEQYRKSFPSGHYLYELYQRDKLDEYAAEDPDNADRLGTGIMTELVERGMTVDEKLYNRMSHYVRRDIGDPDIVALMSTMKVPEPETLADDDLKEKPGINPFDWIGDRIGTSHFAKDRKFVKEYGNFKLTREMYETYRHNFKSGDHLYKVYDKKMRKTLDVAKKRHKGPDNEKLVCDLVAAELLNTMIVNGLELTRDLKQQMSPELQKKLDPENEPVKQSKPKPSKSMKDSLMDSIGDFFNQSGYTKDAKVAYKLAGIQLTRADYDIYKNKTKLHIQFSNYNQKKYYGLGIKTQIADISLSYSLINSLVSNGVTITEKMINDIPQDLKATLYTQDDLINMRYRAAVAAAEEAGNAPPAMPLPASVPTPSPVSPPPPPSRPGFGPASP